MRGPGMHPNPLTRLSGVVESLCCGESPLRLCREALVDIERLNAGELPPDVREDDRAERAGAEDLRAARPLETA
jgi:hypothetical protein